MLLKTLYGNEMIKRMRIEWIDVAKGFSILIMILGHCLNWDNPWRAVIFSFHMPLFLILSGYFYKFTPDWGTFLKKQFRSLLFPYICAIGIQYVLMIFIKDWNLKNALETSIISAFAGLSYTNKISFGIAQGTGVLWFLPLLFAVRIIFHLIDGYAKDNVILSIMITITISFGGYWLGKAGYWLPFSLDVAMFSVCFYGMGYMLAKFNVVDRVYSDPRNMICLLFIWGMGIHQSLSLELAVRNYPGVLTCILVATSGSLVIVCLCRLLGKIKLAKVILTWYGARTVLILCIHHLEWVFIPYPMLGIISPEFDLFICKLAVITTALCVLSILRKIVDAFNSYLNYRKGM